VDVVEDHRRLGRRADDDDPGAVRGGERVVQAQGQGRVAEVVCGELRLPALRGGGALGQGQDPGVARVTWAPAVASARAVSRPIPEALPVTTARLPVRSTPAITPAAFD
jgi:hypothetical protein